jgi:23S rRNA (uracil1939-C5)-methyltransferase
MAGAGVTVRPGSEIVIDVDRPAAGGRMLGRHGGLVVLVRGTIPGERVRARIERVGKGVLYATTVDVLAASPDRRHAPRDPDCGGAVYAHIAYERQRRLKGEIIADALARIGRLACAVPDVIGSPEHGYRMRARLHASAGRLGFFRESTHELCDAAATGQLLPETGAWIASIEALIVDRRLHGVQAIEIAENVPGTERACHIELSAGTDASSFAQLGDAGALTGLSATRADRSGVEHILGVPSVTDVLNVDSPHGPVPLRLRRDVRAFFQGNRFLLEELVRQVVTLAGAGPAVDLYAGVGLFGLALAAAGSRAIVLVESDPVSSASLTENALPFGSSVTVRRSSVETFLESMKSSSGRSDATRIGVDTTVIVDPPRTGLSKAAMQGIAEAKAGRVVYVSCDPATFARDTRILLDAGYLLESVVGIDLFPNTAHVEAVARFVKA